MVLNVYMGKGNILHASKDYETAKKYSINGKVIIHDFKAPEGKEIVPDGCEGGYPIAYIPYGDKVMEVNVIATGPKEMKVNDKFVAVIPEIEELYNKCK